jgi:hypothetical protein
MKGCLKKQSQSYGKAKVIRQKEKSKIKSKSGVNSCSFVVNLKKQSQFWNGQIDVKSYYKGYYDINPLCGAQKNKANLFVLSTPQGSLGQRAAYSVLREQI